MSTATEPEPVKTTPVADDASKPVEGFDPDSFRMTVGEHLEELRGRLILALLGLAAAVVGCLLFSEKVMGFFCAPLYHQLLIHDINPQLSYINLTDPFMTYLKVTLIVAASIAGPWIIYQIWAFIAAGLFPHERKMVTRYVPLSIVLFITGLVFVYLVVLPLSIRFFIEFSGTINVPWHPATPLVEDAHPMTLSIVAGDPAHPRPGALWLDSINGRLKTFVPTSGGKPGEGRIRVIPFGQENLLTPNLSISEYIDLAITFMLTFGIAFQLPLVIIAVVGVGVDIKILQQKRKAIYFGMAVGSAIIAPGDIVTSQLALLIPLIFLYEFGLILARMATKRKAREAAQQTAEDSVK